MSRLQRLTGDKVHTRDGEQNKRAQALLTDLGFEAEHIKVVALGNSMHILSPCGGYGIDTVTIADLTCTGLWTMSMPEVTELWRRERGGK